jgi:hypothetical protein
MASGSTPSRQTFNLPAGTIRAFLALAVLGLSWLVVLAPVFDPEQDLFKQELPRVFLYLQLLLILILASFFSAHGGTIGSQVSTRSPLGLPKGSVRFLLLAGYLGLVGFLIYTQPSLEEMERTDVMLPIAILVGCFFLGNLVTNLVRGLSGGYLPPWFQDFQAWVALLALLGLGCILIVHVVINRSLPMENKINIPTVQSILIGLVGLYFGSRS